MAKPKATSSKSKSSATKVKKNEGGTQRIDTAHEAFLSLGLRFATPPLPPATVAAPKPRSKASLRDQDAQFAASNTGQADNELLTRITKLLERVGPIEVAPGDDPKIAAQKQLDWLRLHWPELGGLSGKHQKGKVSSGGWDIRELMCVAHALRGEERLLCKGQTGPAYDHLRSHIGERAFECPICGKTFTGRQNVARHRFLSQSCKNTRGGSSKERSDKPDPKGKEAPNANKGKSAKRGRKDDTDGESGSMKKARQGNATAGPSGLSRSGKC